MRKLLDLLTPRKDTLQILVKRRGETVGAIYTDGEVEVRSASLDKMKDRHAAPDRNRQ
jgi:hypothetical protein